MIIKGATTVNGSGSLKADIRIRGEKITEIAPELVPDEGEEIIDAEGMLAIPGGIDAHTHFDMPCGDIMTSDDFYYGTRAAVAGGTTSIIDFSEPEQGTSLWNGLERWHEKADGRSFCDYGFHMTVSRYDEKLEDEIRGMMENGVTSFKAYTAYIGDPGVTDRDMYRILRLIKKYDGLLLIHCENGGILDERRDELGEKDPKNISNHPLSRPNEVEHDAVSRLIDMARLLDTRVYIVHTSTEEALSEIEKAKKEGVKVFCETCPHYLLLTDDKYREGGFEAAKYVCSPPFRKAKDNEALLRGIKEGIVDTISTDHCSFNFKGQKDLGKDDFRKIPNGIPGVENRVELMLTYSEKNGIPLNDTVRLLSENPAKIFGLYPKKGVLAKGSDADIVLVKKEAHSISAETQYQKVDYNPYEGTVVDYKVQHVFLRGHQIVKSGKVDEEKLLGQFLIRNTSVK